MKLSGTTLEGLVAVVNGFRIEIEAIDLDGKEVRLKNNGWMDFDEVDIELHINAGEMQSEILDGIVIEEKEQYIQLLQQLETKDRGLRERESNLLRDVASFSFERQKAEEKLEKDRQRFDAYVSQTLFNLNKVLENIKRLDEMKAPTEEYLKFEENTFQKRRSGQL